MKAWLYRLIIGDKNKLEFESRAFNVFSFVGAIFFAIAGIQNYYSGFGGLGLFGITMFYAAIVGFVWFRSRLYKKELRLLAMLVFTAMPTTIWAYNSGSYGGIAYTLMTLFTWPLIFLNGYQKWLIITLNVCIIPALIFYEYYHQGWIDHYQNLETRYFDIIFSIFYTALGLALVMNYVVNAMRVERQKSDRLLHNILPETIANEMKEYGTVEAIHFKEVSMLFTDFVDFTEMSHKIEPNILVQELNDIYSHFDQICYINECERIKTIGDAYFAVCGLPVENVMHAENIMKCANDFLDYLEKRNKEHEIQWKVRVGIHTGDGIAAIVGITKFQYDVFGDTVNTAARLENKSEAMKINVSKDIYNKLKGSYSFIDRGKIEVKGKGALQMYYVDRNKKQNLFPNKRKVNEIS